MVEDVTAKGLARARLTFVSNNVTWGGSEELWSATAAVLSAQGHDVHAYKSFVDPDEPNIQAIKSAGGIVRDLAGFPALLGKSLQRNRIVQHLAMRAQALILRFVVGRHRRPDLAVVSQGGNLDGWPVALTLRRVRVPYMVISQKATDLYWPTDSERDAVRAMYENARWCFFVSEHNLRLTEEQLGIDLPHASVIRNPFLVSWMPREDWPPEDRGLKLACVGRMYAKEKGQDLILRVLAREKWRRRPVHLTFYGQGPQERGYAEMARHLGLERVTFGGFVRGVSAIWDEHHALVLPSRCEGLPLVAVEAMLSGRVAILTDVAGAREVITDNVTGFLAEAATEDALDEALERAWGRRHEWRAIGGAAAADIRQRVPADPAAAFADLVLAVARDDTDTVAAASWPSVATPVPALAIEAATR